MQHVAVMASEVVRYLSPREGGIFVDATLGLGGHAKGILELIGKDGKLIGIDRDTGAINLAKARLSDYIAQCEFVHDDFRNIDKILDRFKIDKIDGILFDLGISSLQIDSPQRGFSFKEDGPLDMRMDREGHISAYDLINSLSEKEISNILKDFGQERWHNRIARRLVTERKFKPIETTGELARIVLKSIPFRRKGRKRIHPATRTFQAFRIAVNRELESLEIGLINCIDRLRVSGRIVVISFHSLEDRIVKQSFKAFEKAGKGKIIVKKPLRPSEQEVTHNPRARSARLRVFERI